jgi:hypothetical protein
MHALCSSIRTSADVSWTELAPVVGAAEAAGDIPAGLISEAGFRCVVQIYYVQVDKSSVIKSMLCDPPQILVDYCSVPWIIETMRPDEACNC